jgi:hypothetical protein
MVEDTGLKIIASEVPLNGITSLPTIMKIYQAVQKLLVVGHADRQTGVLISYFHFWKLGKKLSYHSHNLLEVSVHGTALKFF